MGLGQRDNGIRIQIYLCALAVASQQCYQRSIFVLISSLSFELEIRFVKARWKDNTLNVILGTIFA